VTPAEFRALALAIPEVVESAHMNHPDFRVNGRIFATLGYPDEEWGMVALTPEQQNELITVAGGAFSPVKGAWGRNGSTLVRLRAAKVEAVEHALQQAAAHARAKGVRKRAPAKKRAGDKR
jgi:hypothetical protein